MDVNIVRTPPKDPVVEIGAPPKPPTVEPEPSPLPQQDVHIHIPQLPVSQTNKKLWSWKEILANSDGAVLAGSAGSIAGTLITAEMVKASKEWITEKLESGKPFEHDKILIEDPFYAHEGYHHHEGYLVSPFAGAPSKYRNLKIDLSLSDEFVNLYKLHETTSPVPSSLPPSDPDASALATLRAEVIQEFHKMGVSTASIYFPITPSMLPALRKLNLNPAEFFTARACWQGVGCKRRNLLGDVLESYATLPAGQKTWQNALQAARDKGRHIPSATDDYFVHYFFENRKALKALFRASLGQWQGDRIVCYRGRKVGINQPDVDPLECYTLNPHTAQIFARSGNIKRHRIKMGDVWSVFAVTQNSSHSELEVTVFSRGGKRKGKVITDLHGEADQAKKRFQRTSFTRAVNVSL